MSFWKRTLEIFKAAPVKVEMTRGRVLVGEIEEIGDTSCRIKTADGAATTVQFDEIRTVDEAARL